ncbi:hypothetical protein P8452_56326 [Trifolium repens]|nr:hypothetical protein P8452_56326 [Trifolium repens]
MGSSYEDARNKRMEENKKRMEALNLPKLSQSLYKCLPSQNPRLDLKIKMNEALQCMEDFFFLKCKPRLLLTVGSKHLVVIIE